MDVDWRPFTSSSASTFSSPSPLIEPTPPREINVRVAIGHNQLKDLISCPDQRGELFFVNGKSLARANFADAAIPPGTRTPISQLLSFHWLPLSLTYACSHFALGGSTAEIALSSYLGPSSPRANWSGSIIKLKPRAQLNNSVLLSDKFRLASGYASGKGAMWGLASNNDGTIKVLGFESAGAGGGGGRGGGKEWRKVDVGEVEVGVPVNHCSLSPDGKTLLSVGDSSEVHLFSVMHGGEKFKRVATYTAGEDAGFSTTWSHDGRRFAVAGQDGLVSVWDHRSSKKLAVLSTDPPTPYFHRPSSGGPALSSNPSALSQPSTSSQTFSSDPPNSHARSNPYIRARQHQAAVTSSSHSLSPARVVRFSPASSRKEVLAYTDDTSRVYLVDGLNFDQRTVLQIPHGASGEAERGGLSLEQRDSRLTLLAEEGGDDSEGRTMVGTSGVCFSPCGGWMYAGTEAAIGEWEVGGGKRGWRVEGDGVMG